MRLVNVDNISDKEHVYMEQLRWRWCWLGVYQILHSIHRKKLSVMAYQTQIYIYFYNRYIHSTYTEITLCIFEQKNFKSEPIFLLGYVFMSFKFYYICLLSIIILNMFFLIFNIYFCMLSLFFYFLLYTK